MNNTLYRSTYVILILYYNTCQHPYLLLYLKYFFSLFPFGNIWLPIPGDRFPDFLKTIFYRKEKLFNPIHILRRACVSAGLFSLRKKQMDLFLLSQAGMITYQQLAYCRLHGKTEAAGRLSLKALENDNLVQAKRLPNQYLSKYYFLTSKRRALLRSLFPAALLDYLQITLERQLPIGTQQIYHLIRTNDFYFAYVAFPNSCPVP